MIRPLLAGTLALLVSLTACGGDGHNRVNGGVTVKNGENAGHVSTVNGGISGNSGANVRRNRL